MGYNESKHHEGNTATMKASNKDNHVNGNAADGDNLFALIQKAVQKINGGKENDICRYLPSEVGGYIHHFTMRKMKTEEPEKLKQLISKYIIHMDRPTSVPPKPRAARGSRKRRDQYAFTKVDFERMLNIAKLANDKEMIRKLTPKKDLKTIKRELIISIRHGLVDNDLWQSYSEMISVQNSALSSAPMN